MLLAGSLAACGSDDEMLVDSATIDQPMLDKSCPKDTPEFTVGPMGLSSAPNVALGIKVHVEAASAQPPENDYNDWTIAITDLDGKPLPDANLTFACAFMQAHGHGSNPKMVVKQGDGKYQLVKQNMAMEGGWEIRLWIDPTGGGTTYKGGGTGLNPDACRGPSADPSAVLKACVPS